MNELLLRLLRCTNCHQALRLTDAVLQCEKCSVSYPVHCSIPVFTQPNELSTHYLGQIRYFEREAIVATKTYQLAAWQRSYLERFFSLAPDVNDRLVLDCGTGSGYMAVELARRGAHVIACDLTLRSLIRLQWIAEQEGLISQIDFVCCSAESLPLVGGGVDYIIENAVLEHLPEEQQAINEINRVTKLQAGAMITVPLAYRYLNPLLIPLNYIHDKRIGHLRRYDVASLRHKFAGWQIKKVYYTGHTAKVLKVIMNTIHDFFDETTMEQVDEVMDNRKRGASNICVLLTRP